MVRMLDVARFRRDGFARIDDAFPRELADAARGILWKDTGCDPRDRSTWTRPVVRLGMYAQAPFREAASTPTLHDAFDALVGKGRWRPPRALGTFPVRFPGGQDPGDTGWHVDASFPGPDPADYLSWRINARSRGRALLMLFLFSDVGEHDAPTRIAVGSHLEVARILEPRGEAGMAFTELAAALPPAWARVATATGPAGTVYLCHPLLAHAAQPHRGTEPRFMAQPPLLPADLD
jgi:hypothetical protein